MPDSETPTDEQPETTPALVTEALDLFRAGRLALDKARGLEGRSGTGRYLANANISAETAELWCQRALGKA